MSDDPLSDVEAAESMRNMAVLCRAFYAALRTQGFDKGESFRLTLAWLHAAAGGARRDG